MLELLELCCSWRMLELLLEVCCCWTYWTSFRVFLFLKKENF